jgi:hypothetical protein
MHPVKETCPKVSLARHCAHSPWRGKQGAIMIVTPSSGSAGWRALLADPEKHWRRGHSARTLAHCWEAAGGLPPDTAALFGEDTTLLLALPKHRLKRPGKGRPSQADLCAFLRRAGETIACPVEGQVAEPFGPTGAGWGADRTSAKAGRLAAILAMLKISGPPPVLHHQLLHRTALAVLEVRRFKTDTAAPRSLAWRRASPARLFRPARRTAMTGRNSTLTADYSGVSR